MVSTTKNTFYLLVAYTYQKLIALFYFIFLARYLGVENFGKYTFAIYLPTLLAVLIDFGLFQVLTREIARDKSKAKQYFGNILTFNLVAGSLVLFLIYGLINASDYPTVTKILVYLNGLVIFFESLALGIYQVFRGHLNLKYESIGIIIHKTIMLIVGLILIFLKAPLVLMVLPLLLASFSYLVNAIVFLRKKLKLWPIPRFDRLVLKRLIIIGWPFFVAGLFGKIYATSDTILLSYLGEDTFVGFYTAAQKLTMAFLMLVAGSLATALYPAFSYYFVRSKEYFSQLFHQGVFYLMLLAMPLVFGLLILAKPIILFIYGQDFLPAVPSLMILSLAIPFMFLDSIIAGFLNAADKQKLNTLIHGIGAGIFIILNLFLIPRFYHLGAALSVLISFFLLFLMEVYGVRKVIQIDKMFFGKKVGLIFLASLGMGAVLLFTRDSLHLLLSVIIAMVVYFSVVYFLDLVKKQEILQLKKIIRFK